jgi:precorrin-2/cobalt-factor-2 C20-methyltransferase
MECTKHMMEHIQAEAGHFYAIGIGPGSAELLTYRAGGLIHTADVILAPRSRISTSSLALDTVKPFLRDDHDIIEHVYAMNRDQSETVASWKEAAQKVINRIESGKSVAQITLGDPLIYSTSHYLLQELFGALAPEHIHVVPGISAYQAAGACFGESLAIQEDRVTLMTATDMVEVENALDNCETLVLYKAGRSLGPLADLLERRGLLDRARAACYVEQPNRQLLTTNLRDLVDTKQGYMATIIIQIGNRRWLEPA